MKSFKIKKIRIEKLMTQDELAEKSGISRTIISGLETGKIVNTTTDTLIKLAEVLNCKPSDFF